MALMLRMHSAQFRGFAGAVVLSFLIASFDPAAAQEAAPEDGVPLAALPRERGEHVRQIQAMGENEWLHLGKPEPDPKWGTPGGRSWSAKMPYAPDLRVAFLFGEGVHGWWNEETGRYMDDLWAYDINAHRWICVYPGADVKSLNLKLNEHGVEVTQDGEPLPVAQMAHGYEGMTYDTDLHRFMFMPCPGDYWDPALGERRMKWLGEKSKSVAQNCSPWLYDTRTGKWDRRPTEPPAPGGGYGDVLVYVPTLKKTFLRTAGSEVWWYDTADNQWTKVDPKGPPTPFGIDPTACYDSKRDRIYVGGGSYPVAEGPNALWIYDVKSDTWIDPKPKGQCCGGASSYNTNISTMTYDSVNDVVVLNRHTAPDGNGQSGIWIYDPEANAWSERKPYPEDLQWRQVNAFYDPELNVHIYHTAGDSTPEGTIWAYRVKPGEAKR